MLKSVPYDGAGYLNVGELLPHVLPFTWIWGGRGIGKTFGFFADVRYNSPRKFLIMRRTQKQIDLLSKEMFNPFKPVDAFYKGYTVCKKDKDTGVFYEGVKNENGELDAVGAPVGYAVALSTVHNVRGIDLSDVDIIIYDEFIPEPHERPIKEEYGAFLNAMETIGRNRELKGEPPVQFIGLSNANTLGNPYFLGMGVIRTVDKMMKSKTEVWANEDRGIMLINITHSPISDKKSKTALYKFAGGGSFAEMSLGNDFSLDRCSREGTIPLTELRPLVAVGELCIYEHKRKRDLLYCCGHKSGSPAEYLADDMSLRRFRYDFAELWYSYLDNNIIFQDILCEILFKKYYGT